MKLIVIILSNLFLFACGSKKQTCKLPNPKTIFYDKGKDKFIYYVLLDGYERKCMDSLKMVKMAIKYANDVKIGRPALTIKFYSSEKDFIPNETSQPIHKIDKSGLLIVSFNEGLQPYDFTFYNEQGGWIYTGPLWKPNGE